MYQKGLGPGEGGRGDSRLRSGPLGSEEGGWEYGLCQQTKWRRPQGGSGGRERVRLQEEILGL